jgi:hypothetical protein
VAATVAIAQRHGFDAWEIGRIDAAGGSDPEVRLEGLS